MDYKEKRLSKVIHYDQIDALKGMAIFLVVLGHGIIHYPIDLHQNVVCDYIFRWLSSVHMPLFFIVSGFCFSFKGNYKLYIWKKVKRLLIPYFTFNALDIVPRALFPNLVNRSRDMDESIWKIVFCGGEYWFLYALFIIFLIYPCVDKLIENNLYKYLLVLVGGVIVHFVVPPISIFLLSKVIYYFVFFVLGTMIKKFWGGRFFDIQISKVKTFFLICIFTIIWMLTIRKNISILSIFAALIGIVTLFFCTQYKLLITIFKRFGKYSLQLYLFNEYLLVISRTIIVSILGVTNPFIIIAFNMLVDFFFSYIVIKYICEKIKPVRFLMGMV